MNDADMNRLRWRCRRGLLENDLVLERFLAAHGPLLSGERLSAFERLLDYADDELWGIVSGRSECCDPTLSEVVGLLQNC
jgi:succinate dehydrogenase flavin-adding protein (antitoxin of CptAB toxin-antitoxin module)